MAPSEDHGSESHRNLNEFKCDKCNKKLKNGVQCTSCEQRYHLKCSNVTGTPDDIKWCCVSCGDKNTPLSIIEVKYQNLERELFLLKSENAAYVKMYEDLQAKYLVAIKEIETLKSSFCSKDANLSNTAKKVENIQQKNVKHVQIDSKTNQVKDSKSRGRSTVNMHQLSNDSSTSFDKSQPSTAHTCISANGFEQIEKKTPESDASKNKNEEFTVVQKKKRVSLKQKIGTKPDSTFTVIPQTGWLHVYRLAPETTVEMVTNFLKTTNPKCSFQCEKLNSRGNYASFKLGYPFEIHDEINDSAFWPSGVAIRRFFLDRRSTTNGSTSK